MFRISALSFELSALSYLTFYPLKVRSSPQIARPVIGVRQRGYLNFPAPAGGMQEIAVARVNAHMGNPAAARRCEKHQITPVQLVSLDRPAGLPLLP